jgi:hypothetical protein
VTTKTLTYKVARFNREANSTNLQDLLTTALKKKKAALSRKQEGDGENQFRLINFHGFNNAMKVGEFFDYTLGQRQPLAEIDDNAEELRISTLAPPDKHSEFLHSILYFGLWKNSVILSQSASLRSPQFENYINWLLRDCNLLMEGDFVTLADHPPLEKTEEILNTKGIEFHAPVSLFPIETTRAEKTTRIETLRYKPENIGWELLQSILPPEMSLPTELRASDVIQNSALEVTLYLSWSKVRKDDSTALLDRISNQLRHVDTELDYTIHTRSGKISRDEIKLRRPVSVNTTSDGLVLKSDMWVKMQDWLDALIDEERISPDA